MARSVVTVPVYGMGAHGYAGGTRKAISEDSDVYKGNAIILALLIGISACTGKTSEDLYSDGIKLLQEGKSGGAIVLFKNALEKNQNYLEARYQLARAYMSIKKYELAEKELQKVKLLNPNQPEIILELAKLNNCLGKPDLAIRHAGEYLLEKADSADALEVIGIAYGIKQMPREAETFFQHALRIEPGKPTTRLELAALHGRLGRTESAGELLEEIVRESPANTRALHLLADTEIARGRKVQALKLYKKLCEIDPADPVARYRGGLLHFEMKHFTIAEGIAEELIKQFPAHAEGYRLKGIISYRKNNITEAIASLQHANTLQPSVSGYFFLGLSLYRNGDLESALNQFRRILDRNPSFHQARLLTGTILLQQKRVDDAISELSRLLDADGKNPQVHNLLGSAYMAKGMYEEGMCELDTATKLEPKLVDAYLKKGMLHLSRGNAAGVELDLTAAVRIAPELLNTRLILSSFYEYRNDRARALVTLKEGLAGKKGDVVLYCAMARLMFADNNHGEAVRYLEKAKGSDRAAVAPCFMLGAYYTGIGDTGKALNEYSEVLQKEPRNVKAMLKTASLLELTKRDSEARDWYHKAAETREPAALIALARYFEKRGGKEKPQSILAAACRVNRLSPEILEERVRLQLKYRQYKEALKTCDDIEAISPERAFYRRVSAYLAMKKMPEALKEAERSVTFMPDSSPGYILLASVYQEQGNFERAIETLKIGIQRDGNNPQPVLALASLYSRTGNHALALKTCDELVRKRSGYAPAYFAHGAFLEAQGRKKEAVDKYRAALALSGDYAAALNNLSYLYADGFGTKKEALRLAEKAFSLDPENPGIIDTLGYALLKNNRHQEARESLEKAVALLPDDPTINYHLALAHQAAGDKKLATGRLKKALRKENFATVQQARSLLAELN